MHIYYILNKKVEFYPAAGTLRSLENPKNHVEINSPASRCLLLLIKKQGSVVSPTEIMNEVWHNIGAHVTPNTYYQNISLLRRGLKNVGIEEDIVITVPRIGVTLSANISIDFSDKQIKNIQEEEIQIYNNCDTENYISSPPDNIYILPSETPSRETLTEDQKINKHSTLHYLRERGFASYSAILFLIFISLAITMALKKTEESKAYNYSFFSTLDNCRIFYDTRLNNRFDKNEMMKWAGFFSTDCIHHPYVYISSCHKMTKTSIIRCTDDIKNAKECISEFFVEDKPLEN